MSTIVHSRGVGGQNWVKCGPRSYWITPKKGPVKEIIKWKVSKPLALLLLQPGVVPNEIEKKVREKNWAKGHICCPREQSERTRSRNLISFLTREIKTFLSVSELVKETILRNKFCNWCKNTSLIKNISVIFFMLEAKLAKRTKALLSRTVQILLLSIFITYCYSENFNLWHTY